MISLFTVIFVNDLKHNEHEKYIIIDRYPAAVCGRNSNDDELWQ